MERSPHRLFVWDTETRTFPGVNREVLPLRVWAAEVVQRHGRRPKVPPVTACQGTTADQLVQALEGACRASETTWAFAHNQSFDLGVTRLPLLLLARGWVITSHALTTASPWARLARGSHRLILADSTSWLPGPLEGIGLQVGIDKPPLPADADDATEWAWRCRQDVRILAEALCQLMDWWDRARLGSWSITGPQTGFNAMRHRTNPHVVVIDPDPDARAFERAALVGGRREAWRVGKLPWGDYREIDFRSAHATIAANCPLPKRRSVRFDSMDLDNWRLTSDRWSVIAEVTIRTNTPRYPCTVGGRLWYPVGTFRTILCGPEIAEALRRRELLEVGPGYVYQLGAHMGDWGRWVLDQLARDDPATPAVARTAIKAWSQRVPGKWAARTSQVWHEGQALERGWNVEHGRHHPSGAPCAVLDMAGRRQVILQDRDADDSFPAVLAWIQSEVRVRLGRLIDAIGPDAMVSCNTDGVMYEHARWAQRGNVTDRLLPLIPREKARYSTVEVISPQHLVLPDERRLSGVPASAEEIGPHQYSWFTWPRLPSQIASGESRGYVRDRRTVDLRHVPVNRWVQSDGWCLPVTVAIGEDGANHIQPLVALLAGDQWADLSQRQHPQLRALMASEAV